MLILSRDTSNNTIHIGNDIQIKVLNVSTTGQVRIGIEAPQEVLVLRDELLRREFASFRDEG